MNYKITAIISLEHDTEEDCKKAADSIKDTVREAIQDVLDLDKEDLVAIAVSIESE